VVMDVNTGGILALASLPEFNPNSFARGMSNKEYDILMKKAYPMLNRAISSAFPPGSTFKIITSLGALTEKLITRQSVFYCPGYLDIGGTKINCFVRSGHGSIGFEKSIAQSCDVVFYILGRKLGIDTLINYTKSMGLGAKTGIDLPGEIAGNLPDKHWREKEYGYPWYDGDTVNTSIGQGFVAATPLQVTLMTATLANGGKVLKPKVVSRILDNDGNSLQESHPEIIRNLNFSQEDIETVKQGLRQGVLNGTGAAANSPLISIAGKTGTAENQPCPENPGGFNHSWFTCFAPYENPQIAITVMFEQSGGFGGEYAAPVARKIAEKYLELKRKEQKKHEPSAGNPPGR